MTYIDYRCIPKPIGTVRRPEVSHGRKQDLGPPPPQGRGTEVVPGVDIRDPQGAGALRKHRHSSRQLNVDTEGWRLALST